jgi:single-strand DNA-binding protein
MPAFSQTILVGHMTRDPELRYLPDQTPVVSFGVAVNHEFKTKSGEQRKDVMFMDCSAFGKRGETINQWFKKGKPILVRGRLRLEKWQDKQSGTERSKHTLQVEDFAFVGGKDDGDGERQPSRSSGGAKPQHAHQEPPFSGEKEFQESDIPFMMEWHRTPV